MVQHAREIEPGDLSRLLKSSDPPTVIDVREEFERQVAVIEAAVHAPPDSLETQILSIEPDRAASLVLYCARGRRSAELCERLVEIGYTGAVSLRGGIEGWYVAGLPTVKGTRPDGPEWAPRYARQTRIPQVGPSGQKKLLDARVLLVGAGGLGSPAAIYLAAAGVGYLGLIDFDRVDETNLHRQVLYRTTDVGRLKVDCAKETLQALNPDVHVVTVNEKLTRHNAEKVVGDYDIVLDGADNFQARYLVNDVCLLLNKPNIHGAISQFEGQVSVFGYRGGPCYRCLFPEPPPAAWVPSCADAGVLGVLPGVVGTLQATEAVKLILGIGDLLVGKLLRFDALAMSFERFEILRRDDCAYCRTGGPFPGLIDYEDFCGSG